MAKAKRRRKTKPGKAKPLQAKSKHFRIADLLTPKAFVIGIFLLAGAILVPSWLGSSANEAAFEQHARAGGGLLGRVKTHRDLGATHVAQGLNVVYASRFPTSGSHWPRSLRPGFYKNPQRGETLVHALEHGNVVIYYETLGAGDEETLREWTTLFNAPWSGLVAVPKPGLGKAIVLTAWNRSLRLRRFEPKAVAAFVDAFRGRGPENRVR